MPTSAPTLVAGRSTPMGRRPALFVIQALSLDVVAGVACAAAFSASASGAAMGWGWWIALPAATWVVYSLDHLFDTRRGMPASTPRRSLHRCLRPALVLHTAIVAAVALAAGMSLRPSLWPGAAVLVGAASLHLVLAQSAGDRFPKELTAGAVYTLAIWFGPLLVGAHVDGWVLMLAAAHGCAALANLVVFTLFEQAADAADGQASAARGWGVAPLRYALGAASVVGLALAATVAAVGPARLAFHAVVLVILVATPTLLDALRQRVAHDDTYRTWGDLAFLLMLLPAVVA